MKTAKKAKLKTLGSFIIGFPYEKEEDMKKTIRFAKFLDVDYAQFTVATPFPGTELWNIAVTKNLLLTKNWRDFTTVKIVMKNIYVPPSRVRYLLEWAYLSFYLSPKRVIKDLARDKGILTSKSYKSVAKNINLSKQEKLEKAS